ncbi:MAG: hypothetical protein K1V84_03675 [Muribaculaceae bacterium]
MAASSVSDMLRRGVCVALVLMVSLAAAVMAQRLPSRPTGDGEALTLVVDRMDYRSDLTRLYGRLVGRPHTSCRVDAVSLTAGKRVYTATDIDGVDFKRWFQWEDDGEIPVEIDFPKMKRRKAFTLMVDTPRGKCEFNIKL